MVLLLALVYWAVRSATVKPTRGPAEPKTEPVAAVTREQRASPEASKAPPAAGEATAAPIPVAAPVTTVSRAGLQSNVPPSDPKQAAATAKVELATKRGFDSLKVQGVFYRSTNPMVMINGKLFGQGKEVNGVKVVAIEPTRVVLCFGTEQKVVPLK